MSIKGIDSQIMVQRTTEYVRDTSTLNKHAELLQDKNAIIGHREDLHKQNMVIQTNETDGVRLSKDGGGSAKYEGKRSKKKKKEESGNARDAQDSEQQHIIDIRI